MIYSLYMLDHIYGLTYITVMTNVETVFKLLSDTTRLRALALMHNHGELCVCELTHALNISQPKISRHLAHLRDANLVIDRRQGLWIYYQINPALPDWVSSILKVTIKELSQSQPYTEDNSVLIDMPNRPGASCCA